MKLSVITPVFNGERFLAETIESVLRCCREIEFEYLVIDDGSTDSTSKILETFKDKILIINKPNSGQADSINEGLSLAKGEYGIIVNADDPLVSEKLFDLSFKEFDDNDLIVCYPDWEVISSEGKTIKRIKTKDYSKKILIGHLQCLPGPGAVFRIACARRVNGWNRNFKYVADYDFWIRLSEIGKFKRIPQNLAAWRMHEDSTSISQKNFSMALERIRVIEELPFLNELSPKLRNKALASAYYQAAVLSYFDPTIPGKEWFKKSLFLDSTIVLRNKPTRTLFLLLFPWSAWLAKYVSKKFRHLN
jgi:glycosyltransferase involved in cell wall biosynthesis